MAGYERKPRSRGGSKVGPNRNFGTRPEGRRDFGSRDSGSRDSGSRDSRGPSRFGRDRGELRMTRVTCDSCGKKCEVPFRPTEGKPVYCRECFGGKDEKKSSSAPQSCSCKLSDQDLDIINGKLNKIMEALGIQ